MDSMVPKVFVGNAQAFRNLQSRILNEFYMYRVVFLIIGIVLLTLASRLSKSVAVYYSVTMFIGIIILIGVGGYFLQYISGIVKICTSLYLSILLVTFAFMFGAWSGFWTVQKFVATKDNSIDISTSIFVSWSIRAFAVILILQSSGDPLLAGGALISGILISSIVKSISRKPIGQRIYKQDDETDNCGHSFSHADATSFASPLPRGINNMSRTIPLSDSDTFPSSFHKTPEGIRKLTKEELEKFTRKSTEKAMKELVSSPGFGEWAMKNAKRINVNPIKESSSKLTDTVKRRRWFLWF